MNELVVWALRRARQQTLALVADLPQEQMCLQSIPGEHHPSWTLGHLLLSDTYLLSLLRVRPLSDDFPRLLRKYGPGASPTSFLDDYDAKHVLVQRLAETGSVRVDAVLAMTEHELAALTPDQVLARSQPTIGHHVQSLVFHEGYHGGQLSAWRKAHRLSAAEWTFAQHRA
jgi:DinB family protein